jgi:N-acetylmuramoyl-L-alanine amidase
MNDYSQFDDRRLLALCIWREARGTKTEAKFAVGCSIRNRVNHPCWWGKDYRSVILKPWQYSSFNEGDPNETQFPFESELIWNVCLEIAQEVMDGQADTTQGATSYFDKSLDSHPPSWASALKHTVDIVLFHFFAVVNQGNN